MILHVRRCHSDFLGTLWIVRPGR